MLSHLKKKHYTKNMKGRYINPFNDFFIRFLFGSEGNEEICRGFVNSVLQDAGFPPVTKLIIKNPFNLKTEIKAKESITDISRLRSIFGFAWQTHQIGDSYNVR